MPHPDVLGAIGSAERSKLTGINDFKESANEYSERNSSALSDGDKDGKGELNGNVGSSDDIAARNANTRVNVYGPGSEYSDSSPRALSDGDEHGKGEHNGNVGGATDIKSRTTLKGKNIYSASNPYI